MNVSAKSKHQNLKPVRVLFVCLGNICRSPAADGIMHHLVGKEGLDNVVYIDSAGTYGGHSGELPDSRMRQHARRRGYDLTHRSRKVTSADFERFDMLIAMDDYNYRDLHHLAPTVADQQKVYRMTDFATHIRADHVPDPYYEGAEGFERVLDILEDACNGLLYHLKNRAL